MSPSRLSLFGVVVLMTVALSFPAAAALDGAGAAKFARLALAGLDREYPNKPGEVLTGPDDLRTPRQMHPAFYGHFDWHSSVHGHWVLVRTLRLYPDMAVADAARKALDAHLTAANIAAETAYFEAPSNRGFERMYGWAWALRLAAELELWDDPDARRWAAALQPLEHTLVALAKDFLPRLTYPIRTGVHQDTAFALSQMLDYARIVGDASLERLIIERARSYFLNDREYPTRYEPSGEDFFSSGLNVADLLRRILPGADYSEWLDAYLPGVRTGELGGWSAPAEVSDLSDPRIVHLVGLNLSRAWTMRGVASALADDDPRRAVFAAAATAHAEAGLKYIFSGHYEGEHWLGTFAVYLLTDTGIALR